jgi:cytoskeletal protein CcmA (bactofilin family)
MSKHGSARHTRWLALIERAAIASAIALIVPATALAAEVRSGDTVTIGQNEVVTDDLYVFGSKLLIQGTVNGDVVAAGSSVTIAGHVTGNLMAGGNTLVVNGPVDGSVRLAGNQVTVSAPVGSDALIAGANLTVSAPGRIGRDVVAGGNAINLQAPVGRNVSAGGNTLTVGSTIGGAVNASVTDLVFDSGAVVQGPVTYASDHEATLSSGARVASGMQRTAPPVRAANPWQVGGVDTLGLIRGFIGLASVGILLLLAFPRAAATSAATIQHRWAASMGVGFALLAGIPVLALVVFGLGLVVGGWWIGLMLLSLYAILMVVGYLASAEWLGLAALRLSRAQGRPFWALLLGLLILGLTSVIPVLGALAGFGAIVFGIGAVTLSGWRQYRGTPTAERSAPNGRVVVPPVPVTV